MGQAPDPGAYGAGLSAGYHHGVGIPNRGYVHPGHPIFDMPDAQQQKIALHPFDGKELYHGLA